MTRKAPSGARHASCLDHVQHAYTASGWLCITTTTDDMTWPHADTFRPVTGSGEPASGPFIPASAPDWRPVDRAADMVSFADHLTTVRADHRAAELARQSVPALTADDYAIVDPVPDHPGATMRRYRLPAAATAGTSTRHLPYDSAADRRARADLAASLDVRKGRTPRPAPTIADDIQEPIAPTVRKARKVRAVKRPSPMAAAIGALAERTAARGAAPLVASDPEPLPGQRDADGEPSATGTAAAHDFGMPCDCGACVEPMPEPVEPVEPVPFATLAAEAIADALTRPAPVVAPSVDAAYYERVAAYQAQTRADMAAYLAQTAPIAPVVAPTADGRPVCPHCGQTFRKSGNGLAWHVTNRHASAPTTAAIVH